MRKKRSKKQSGTSSPRERPDTLPPIYIDESLSQTILWKALVECGCTVFRRADKFPAGVSDPEWLVEAGEQRWLVLTKDQAIMRHPHEMTALTRAGVRAFVLTAGEMTGEDQARLFSRLVPKMRQWVGAIKRGPFVVRVNSDRSTELLHPAKKAHKLPRRLAKKP